MNRLNNPIRGSSKPNGALIFTPTKELCAQVYNSLKRLDLKNQIRIFRTGSLGYDFKQKNRVGKILIQTGESDHFFLSFLDWKKVDILISTPTQLDILMKSQKSGPELLNPKFTVLDEFDQLLTDRKYYDGLTSVLDSLGSNVRGKQMTENHLDRKFVLAGASILKTIFGKPAKKYLDMHFHDLNLVQSERFLKVNKKIAFEDYNVESLNKEDRMLLLRQIIDRDKPERVLVFCNDASDVLDVQKYLEVEADIQTVAFHSKMSDSERASVIYAFENGKQTVLVSTDLSARGLDFKNIPLVVQFGYAENGINLLHRIGRTGRMGASGRVISFVDAPNHLLYSEFMQSLKEDKPLDSTFSRNRSFNKRMKRIGEEVATETNDN